MPKVRVVEAGDLPPKSRAYFVRRVKNPTTPQALKEAKQQITLVIDDEQETILTPLAAARRLGCTEARVGQLIAERKISAQQLGRTWLILESDLDRFISQKARTLRSKFPFLDEEK